MTDTAALVCREISLRHFRNFERLELRLPAVGVAIIGDNGSGKTNLLEAIHYLEILRSFRGVADEQLVRFGADACHVRGRFEDRVSGRALEITAAYEPRTRRKRVTVDGTEAERLGDAIGGIGTVIFSPSDVEIVAGSPGERRRYLDIVLSLNVRGYVESLMRYRQVLRQRNALLRDGRASDAIPPWDAALIEHGTRIIVERARWVNTHAARYAELYQAIGGGAAATMSYDSDLPIEAEPTPEAVETSFAQRLERVAMRERERRVTLAGPHRDDLALHMKSADDFVDLRQYGSGGQVRTGAIALRMIEAETVREARGFQPLLLLDDVFAELDVGRSRRILELLGTERRGQVILTAPKEGDVLLNDATASGLVAPLERWRIAHGEVFT